MRHELQMTASIAYAPCLLSRHTGSHDRTCTSSAFKTYRSSTIDISFSVLVRMHRSSVQCVAIVSSWLKDYVLFFSSAPTALLLIQELAKCSDICASEYAMESVRS